MCAVGPRGVSPSVSRFFKGPMFATPAVRPGLVRQHQGWVIMTARADQIFYNGYYYIMVETELNTVS